MAITTVTVNSPTPITFRVNATNSSAVVQQKMKVLLELKVN